MALPPAVMNQLNEVWQDGSLQIRKFDAIARKHISVEIARGMKHDIEMLIEDLRAHGEDNEFIGRRVRAMVISAVLESSGDTSGGDRETEYEGADVGASHAESRGAAPVKQTRRRVASRV